MKLEPRIFERIDKIEDKIIFGLQNLRMTTRNTTKNYWGHQNEEWKGLANDEKNLKGLGEKAFN